MDATRNQGRERTLTSVSARQYGVVSRQQARLAGFSDMAIAHGLRSGRLKRVLPRVLRISAVSVTWEQKLMAAVLWAGVESWASHRSAAALWAFPGCEPGPIEILTTRALRAPPGIVVRRVEAVPSWDVQTLRRLPVTNPVRTLFDLAGVMQEDALEVVLDHVVHQGFASVNRLRRRLAERGGHGVRGSACLRRLLDVRGPGEAVTQSVLESRFIQLLRKKGLPLPHKQVRVTIHEESIYRVDFHFQNERLIVEVDGGRWHSSRVAMQRDRRRDNALALQGRKVLRLTWFDVMHDEDYVERHMKLGLGLNTLFG